MKKTLYFSTILAISLLLGACNLKAKQSTQTPVPVATVTPSTTYTCPQTEWVNCMPGPDITPKPECQADFLDWAKTNCPGFQGAAF